MILGENFHQSCFSASQNSGGKYLMFLTFPNFVTFPQLLLLFQKFRANRLLTIVFQSRTSWPPWVQPFPLPIHVLPWFQAYISQITNFTPLLEYLITSCYQMKSNFSKCHSRSEQVKHCNPRLVHNQEIDKIII